MVCSNNAYMSKPTSDDCQVIAGPQQIDGGGMSKGMSSDPFGFQSGEGLTGTTDVALNDAKDAVACQCLAASSHEEWQILGGGTITSILTQLSSDESGRAGA